MFRTSLTMAGFEVQEAADGLTALRSIDQRAPDVVVLDLVLPGLNGDVVQQEIAARPHTRHIPIVIVTASPEPVHGTCVLRKPVALDHLVQTVRSCLASQHTVHRAQADRGSDR